ncbi:SAM-dependent methyltransferase [Haliangium ochraceum]|uniref:Methyltransferase type 12 n=1 Tax=Haliangium ochraceum (strain DSM 14365 / JCM 11303 / SMP-2) TaxID=502025 RepID=D0LR66_HALO1|nr:class I SAM-dependent methyltransferase [Haliangium ochraceum]ACY15574.1 Methyltransferase type 12 [Haliangium ochraceum DSM 14365]
MSQHAERVAHYYDSNTRRFLRFGEGSSGGAIHRCVWTPDAHSEAEAVDTVNRLLIERLRPHLATATGAGHILDLGCGVGATMVRLAEALDAELSGVTISRVQAELGERRFAELGLSERCRILCADFAALPAQPRYDAIVAIEAVVHASDLAALMTSLGERLRPGGRVLLIDDWMTDHERGLAARERCLAQFRAGWRIGSLHSVAEVAAMAADAGLRLDEDLDLTPHLRLGRPRDRVIEALVGTVGRLPGLGRRAVEVPFWGNMSGGSALQTGLRRGWLAYRLLSFQRC